MTKMGFDTIFAGQKKDFAEPVITTKASLKTVADVVEQIESFSDKQGVLVYANEPFYSQLADVHKL